MTTIQVPYDMPGKIFRGVLPPPEQAASIGGFLTSLKITTIFLLATNEEMEAAKVPNLKTLYEECGCKVVHCPIEDGKTIPLESMKELIQKVISAAMQGENALIHCKAGRARTGMVLSCLAMETLNLPPANAQLFVEAFLGKSQNSGLQKTFLAAYKPGFAASAALAATGSSSSEVKQ